MHGDEVVGILSKWLRFADDGGATDNARAYCPFHKGGNEYTPSLYVYVGRETGSKQVGVSYCQTCAEGWTLSRLLLKLGADREIIEEVRKEFVEARSREKERDKLMDLDFTQTVLPETVMAVFDYCPRDLLDAGFKKDILRDNDVGFDRDRQRITFGVRDHFGNLIGVSGRTVIDEEPRYKIYRSEFYGVAGYNYKLEKSLVLWGLDKFYNTRLHAESSGPVVLCEGFKAALWVKQAGHTDVVVPFGTALSDEQHILLQRVTNAVVLFLDNDPPGVAATFKRLKQLRFPEILVADYQTVAPISPDDLTPDRVRYAIEHAIYADEWRARYGS